MKVSLAPGDMSLCPKIVLGTAVKPALKAGWSMISVGSSDIGAPFLAC